MKLASFKCFILLAAWSLLYSGTAESQTGERGVGFVVSCSEASATSVLSSGIVSRSLASGKVTWKAIPNKIVDVGPVTAGHAVAIITDIFDVVYAFSTKTGKPLWRRQVWSSNLGTDGNYFYVLRNAYDDLQALDPGTGKIAWSLKLVRPSPGFPGLLGIHHGLLFTTQAVVDLSRRKVIHVWTKEPFPDSAWVSESGEIVIGDSAGGITVYNSAFQQIKKAQVSGGEVVQAVTTENGVLAAAYQYYAASKRGRLTSLTESRQRQLSRLSQTLSVNGK